MAWWGWWWWALVVASVAAAAAMAAVAPVLRLAQAERLDLAPAGAAVALPDLVFRSPGAGTTQARYRIVVPLDAPLRGQGLYFTGLLARPRIALNGEVLLDHLDAHPPQVTPRSIDAIVLVDVPDRLWRAGPNELLLDLQGGALLSLSPVEVGPLSVLVPRHRWRVLVVVLGPAAVAVVVACLGLAVLLLWWRRREVLYGTFGAGALGWALHSLWTVLPWRLLPGVHFGVWWHALYAFFVVMLTIFCLRFSGPPWRRLERAAPWGLAAVVVVLYLAGALDLQVAASSAVRLCLIGLVALGVTVVARHALRRRSVESTLILASALAGLLFGAIDWARGYVAPDYHPVYLVPYAALLFVATVAWTLIDRFVRTSQEMEVLNRDLEQRVQAQNAELHQTLAQVRSARDAAEGADRAKSSFLAAASHDLRQPVHALGLYLAALSSQPLPGDSADVVQRMGRSLTALDDMFNALLDISRMDAGAVVPQPRAFDPAPLVRRLADVHAALADERGLRLSLWVRGEDQGWRAHGDPLLIERIVGNLLGNAVRHTRHGGVLVSLRLRQQPAPHWRIEVWDTGPGIAESERDRIWEEFYQVGNPERDRAAGLGLGLSIVRRLARLLQLPVVLHSRPGHGSRFELQLPATRAPLGDAAVPVSALPLRPGLRVAVIEDDPEVRDAMVLLLQRWGCVVAAAADGPQLLAADPVPADAVVADWRLRGGQDGAAQAQWLFDQWGQRRPLLVITGETAPATLAMIRALGLVCLPKPVAPEALWQWLAGATQAAPVRKGPAP